METYEQAVQEGYTSVLVSRDEVLDEYLGILKDGGYSLESILGSEPEFGEELLKKRFEEYAGNGGNRLGMAETMLFKVPIAKPWELVAYVSFGGWNDCSEVKEMMAVCK